METWDRASYPLWHGAAQMSSILKHAGPADALVRGEGAWVIDAAGRRFLDARAGMANVMLGYGRQDIAEAMYHQALELPYACMLRFERPATISLEYARVLVDLAPPSLTRVRFAHTGSSAVETALQMARSYHRNLGRPARTWILSLENSYHGSTLMSMAASGQPFLHELYGPRPHGFRSVLPPDSRSCEACRGSSGSASCSDELLSVIDEIGPERVAAVIVEPVMGANAFPLPPHYLRRLREVCDDQDIVLIFDEVVTGFGRLGQMFAADYFGVTPDIMCLAKGLTSGYAPLGAILVDDRVFDAFDLTGRPHFALGSTTDAHPVSCAAGLAVARAYERENILQRATEMGERLRASLGAGIGASPLVSAVRGIGAYVAIDIADPRGKYRPIDVLRRLRVGCERRGVLIDYTSGVLGLLPPLILSPSEADLLVATLAEVFDEIAAESEPVSDQPGTVRQNGSTLGAAANARTHMGESAGRRAR